MTLTTERLIRESDNKLGMAQGDMGGGDFGDKLTQLSIAYSLLAIAQELKRHNDENNHDCLERIRQDIGE